MATAIATLKSFFLGAPGQMVLLLSLLSLLAGLGSTDAAVSTVINSTTTAAPQVEGRIVNGHVADKKYFSFQLLINIEEDEEEDDRNYCGGSIISPLFGLTAAHCFGGVNGTRNLLKTPGLKAKARYLNDGREGGLQVAVAEVTVHKDYPGVFFRKDIAIIKFASPLPVGTQVQSLRLSPHERNLRVGSDLTASGWGRIFPEGARAEKLLAVTNNNEDPSTCIGVFNNEEARFDDAVMICDGCEGAGTGTCQGDSGGPVTVTSASGGGPIQVGVVSWGSRPCTGEGVGVKARVSALLPWIESRVGTPLRSTVQASPTTDCDNCNGDQNPEGPDCAAANRYNMEQAMVESVLSASFRLRKAGCMNNTQRLSAYFDFPVSVWGRSFTHSILGRLRSGIITVFRDERGDNGQGTYLLDKALGALEINTPLSKPVKLSVTPRLSMAKATAQQPAAWTIETGGCNNKYRYAVLFSLQKNKGEPGALHHYHQISLAV